MTPTNSFLFWEVLTPVAISVKIDSENATVRVLADGQTHRQTQSDLVNLCHAICYSYVIM